MLPARGWPLDTANTREGPFPAEPAACPALALPLAVRDARSACAAFV